jgi:hypothetical protein
MFTVLLLVALQQPQPVELPPPWEAKETIQRLRDRTRDLSQSLGALQVLTWQGTGASNYVAVVDSARRQVAAIGGALDRLAAEPQRLSSAMHLFMALQQITVPLDTLTKGVAQFQPDAAGPIDTAANALLNEREKFVQYVMSLVQFNERAADLARREADTCREQLFKRASEPVRAPPRRR